MSALDEQLLLLTEVARICRAPLSSVRHWVASGKLRSLRPARRRLVRKRDLDEFINNVARREDGAP